MGEFDQDFDELEQENVSSLDLINPDQVDLMYPGQKPILISLFFTNQNPSILGILLEEAPDSFLVGLPATVEYTQNELKFVPVSNYGPLDWYIRIFKSSLFIGKYLPADLVDPFKEYISDVGASICPEVLDALEIDFEPEEGTEERSKMELIEKRVEEAIKNGEFINNAGSTFH